MPRVGSFADSNFEPRTAGAVTLVGNPDQKVFDASYFTELSFTTGPFFVNFSGSTTFRDLKGNTKPAFFHAETQSFEITDIDQGKIVKLLGGPLSFYDPKGH